MTAVSATLRPTPEGAQAAAQKTAQAAKMLEAYFLRRIMAEVRQSSDGGLIKQGFGGEMFREMLDEALADRMAEGGGVGLAPIVEKQLGGDELAAAAGAGKTSPAGLRALRTAYGASSVGAAWRAPLGGPVGAVDPSAPGKLWTMPVQAERISSGFGKIRFDPTSPTLTRTHKGLDMTASIGTPVAAARAGVVIRAGVSTGGFGNVVVVDHGNGVHSYYGHLSSVDIQVGQQVAAGTHIGKVGSTGRSSGPHLHFEVRKDGVSIDPTIDIEGLKVGDHQTNR
ncbi:MAG TPA: peptidoglycan DD-metalloendopeptidase family protein [Kofleriaceae bacterium]|nr:peptidoglycan DD-metalloendopeptidase family protein [Kofleriaceae bacterium]